MLVDELVELLKSKITPQLLIVIIKHQKSHILFLEQKRIVVQGLPSGNLRITVSRRNIVEEYFILNYWHFHNNALKVNQWR